MKDFEEFTINTIDKDDDVIILPSNDTKLSERKILPLLKISFSFKIEYFNRNMDR